MSLPFSPTPKPKRKYRARKLKYYKKSGVYATPVGFTTGDGGAATRRSVLLAAEMFAVTARALGSSLCRSTRIPPATAVVPVGEQVANVETDGESAPNAAPFEFGENHPVYGRPTVSRDKWTWRKQPKRPYLDITALDPITNTIAGDIYADAETALLAEEYDLEIE